MTPCAAPAYFEYIGTGNTSNTAKPDQLYTQTAINAIPLPTASGSTFYFIVFGLSDQQLAEGSGQSTGQFGPFGLYQSTSNTWTPDPINYLKSRAKVYCICLLLLQSSG